MARGRRSGVGPMAPVPRCLSKLFALAEAAVEAGARSPRRSWARAPVNRAMTSLLPQTRQGHLPTRNRQIAPVAAEYRAAPLPCAERQWRAALRRDVVDAEGRQWSGRSGRRLAHTGHEHG